MTRCSITSNDFFRLKNVSDYVEERFLEFMFKMKLNIINQMKFDIMNFQFKKYQVYFKISALKFLFNTLLFHIKISIITSFLFFLTFIALEK